MIFQRNNSTFSDKAFNPHYFSFDSYKYKLRLEYITPIQREENLKWILEIEGIKSKISISKSGSQTDETILEMLKYNLEEPCGIPNSRAFAANIFSNILKLTEKYSTK